MRHLPARYQPKNRCPWHLVHWLPPRWRFGVATKACVYQRSLRLSTQFTQLGRDQQQLQQENEEGKAAAAAAKAASS
jgi:hypothetical protein